MALLALTHSAPAEYFMCSVLIAAIIVSYLASRLSGRALKLRRAFSDRVFEGEPFTVHLEAANEGRFPRFLVELTDELPEFIQTKDPHEFVVPSLWSGEHVALSYTATARKRGAYAWPPAAVAVSDPCGLFPRTQLLATEGEALVYPRPLELSGSVSLAGVEARGQSTGERARGGDAGLEFYGVRDYLPGDELRRIHWPATARHNQLTVIEFDRGASENIAVILDAAAGTEFGQGLDTTLEVGVRAAASLVRWALRQEGEAQLAVAFPYGPESVKVDLLAREADALELLARVRAEGALTISELVSWVGTRLAPEVSIVVITAHADPGLTPALQALYTGGGQVSVLLLDRRSFDAKAPVPRDAAQSLAATGARIVLHRRTDDLRESLFHVLHRRN
jgi:uncharacterized protein (DUF58 family)